MNANSLLASPTGLSPYLRFGCLSCRLFYYRLWDLYKKVRGERGWHTLPPVTAEQTSPSGLVGHPEKGPLPLTLGAGTGLWSVVLKFVYSPEKGGGSPHPGGSKAQHNPNC